MSKNTILQNVLKSPNESTTKEVDSYKQVKGQGTSPQVALILNSYYKSLLPEGKKIVEPVPLFVLCDPKGIQFTLRENLVFSSL